MLDAGNQFVPRQASLLQTSRKRPLNGPRSAWPSGPQAHPTQEFANLVRDRDLSHIDDSQIVDRLDALKQGGLDERDALVETFAIIRETIGRRLGAWRLFDPDFDYPAIAGLTQPVPGRGGPDETVAQMMTFVAEESKTRYFAEILLPADFYRAVERSSVASALRFEPTDEQIVAGSLMLDKTVVEMDAGEGKTVAAAFPVVVQALRGRKVHVITANDYLALRDAELLAPVYESLGLKVGALLSRMSDTERRSAYRNDIVYGTLREFGFDYLRDNLRYSQEEFVQGLRQVAIVDEADHALIDEARTPLIISGRPSEIPRSIFRVKRTVEDLIEEQRRVVKSLADGLTMPIDKAQFERFATLFLSDPGHDVIVSAVASDKRLLSRVRTLIDEYAEEGVDNRLMTGLLYAIDVRRDLIMLADAGYSYIEERLGPVFDTADLGAELAANDADRSIPLLERRQKAKQISRKVSGQYGLVNQVRQMLRGYLLIERDRDYIVSDGEVVLIDDLTGRRKSDSKYQHGLQTALEAKEGVRVRPDPVTLAYLTIEGFVRQYQHVSGMTGTAIDARDQFRRSYGLTVERVQPTHAPRRVDHYPRIYATQGEKFEAVAGEVRQWHEVGRPVLIGTRTVEQSDEVSRALDRAGIPHNRLNAVTNSDEARIVREAGAFGAVTVATNMAGRGTDILLDDHLDERLTDRFALMMEDIHKAKGHGIRVECSNEHLAGQLASRLAQQGVRARVMGTSVVVDGIGDEVRLEFGLGLHVIGTEMNESARVDRQLRGRSGRQGQHGSSRFVLSLEDRPIVTSIHGVSVSKGEDALAYVEKVQSSIEQDDEASRTVSSDFAQVIERQTLNYYETRSGILGDADFDVTCREVAAECVRRLVARLMPASEIGDYQRRFEDLAETLQLDFGLDVGEHRGLGAEALCSKIAEAIITRFGDVAAALSQGQYNRLAKTLLLQVGDELWSEHLDLLQDMMLSAQLSSAGHSSAVTGFVFRADEAYGTCREQVNDEFVARLATFEIDEMVNEDGSIVLTDDVEAILV